MRFISELRKCHKLIASISTINHDLKIDSTNIAVQNSTQTSRNGTTVKSLNRILEKIIVKNLFMFASMRELSGYRCHILLSTSTVT